MTVIDLARQNNIHLTDSISYLIFSDMCVETFGRPLSSTLQLLQVGEWASSLSLLSMLSDLTPTRSSPTTIWSPSVSLSMSSSESSSATMSICSFLPELDLEKSIGEFSFGEPNIIFDIGDDVIVKDVRWIWAGRVLQVNQLSPNQIVLTKVAKILSLGKEAKFLKGSPPLKLQAYPDHVRKVVTYTSGKLLCDIGHTLFR